MPNTRPYVYVIAGHDPSSGAGLTADIKTLEANKVYGLSVCSALTYQHESRFDEVEWISPDKIIRNLEILADKYPLNWIKIGIIEHVEVLQEILTWIKGKKAGAKVILDPVFRASAGGEFQSDTQAPLWRELLGECHLITPNWEEIQLLFPEKPPLEAARLLGQSTIVYLKGGHNSADPGTDYLFSKEKEFRFRPKGQGVSPKHGSGCVLASSITAQLARGFPLQKACLRAKRYTTSFLSSHPSLLGYHQR
ncbi:MAG: hydroxymethylpyrimidine/phosphomethylpyrimidine kinase [Bacteroidota bacterium]